MTLRVVWHTDTPIRQAIPLLEQAGLMLVCGPFGLRAQTRSFDRVEELVGTLITAGFRPGTPARKGRRRGRR